ncbi:MAG: tRNA (N6-isopentenyl adenosine(37)-C2)-methylthiotransferase MiaB [Kiritimatiellae bacterium]|nr:tRNA (N6-isopentenyl adenosine(37)-C2)-methylthiotransferase MiaB [Kiritimatiellia bacterium]
MKFYIHTYGCQMNVRDSEAVESLMIAAGHEKAASEDDAEVVIINSCTVRQKAEEKAVGKSGNMIAAGKITGMMGCAVKRMGEDIFKRLPKLHFAVGPRAFGLIPRIVSEGRYPVLELGEDVVPVGMDAHVDTGWQSFVTVLLGCDNRCSYCIVPDVRGHEYSRPAKEVVAEVAALAKRGVKEVCLLGQSVLRYGIRNTAWDDDEGEAFPRLLRALNEIDGLERIRFTSAHPKGCTDELIRVYRECPKVCRHLHLPVQSGSDRVLAEMGRRYTRAEYLAAVAKLREFDPEFAVTTDVIVGYPGETAEDFEATRSLMEEAGFDNAFVFKYSPRPGTRSAALEDDVPKEEKERRDQVLLADQELRGQKRNDRLVGTVREVLFEGPSKRKADRFSGRDGGNRIVVWDKPADCSVSPAPGDKVRLEILEAHPQILIGRPV